MKYRTDRNERGQALVEFALVISLLAFLLLGIFDFGYAVFTNNLLNNAAREGARAGSIISNSNTTICNRIRNTAPTLNFACDQDIGVRILISPQASRIYEQPITITVRYNYVPLTPIVGWFSPGGIRLSATSAMIVEGVYEPTP